MKMGKRDLLTVLCFIVLLTSAVIGILWVLVTFGRRLF